MATTPNSRSRDAGARERRPHRYQRALRAGLSPRGRSTPRIRGSERETLRGCESPFCVTRLADEERVADDRDAAELYLAVQQNVPSALEATVQVTPGKSPSGVSPAWLSHVNPTPVAQVTIAS